MNRPPRVAGDAAAPSGAGRTVCAVRGPAALPGDPAVRAPGDRTGGDRGSATVYLLAVGLVLVVFGIFGAAVGAARVARQQARVAADLGALAGAGRAVEGPDTACAVAGAIVRANGGRPVACRLDGLDVLVTVEITVTALPGLVREVSVTSRAGPVRG